MFHFIHSHSGPVRHQPNIFSFLSPKKNFESKKASAGLEGRSSGAKRKNGVEDGTPQSPLGNCVFRQRNKSLLLIFALICDGLG